MKRLRRELARAVVLVAAAGGCAHVRGAGTAPPPEPTRRAQAAAAAIKVVALEDDYLDARLVLQALPTGAPERAVLRAKLLTYLLGPLAPLDAEALRAEPREAAGDDVFDRVFESFKDGLDLVEAGDLWSTPVALTPPEADLLAHAARLVAALFAPRGADVEVATALAVLASIAPGDAAGRQRLDDLLHWSDENASAGSGEGRADKQGFTSIRVLEKVLEVWPSPDVAERLVRLYDERQEKFLKILRQPPGSPGEGRRALGDLLLMHGDELRHTAANLASAYLRCGQIAKAAEAARHATEQAGDDPDLRQALSDAAKPSARAADQMTLARRFLPQAPPFNGTASDGAVIEIAAVVLEAAVRQSPRDGELAALAGVVARGNGRPYLALRHFEEARALLDTGASPPPPALVEVARHLVDLTFVRLRLRLAPDALEAGAREADAVRAQFAEMRKRFAGTDLRAPEGGIDFEVARTYLNAGRIDQAEPLFLKARADGAPATDVAIELANIAAKRGDHARAAEILREGLAVQAASSEGRDTIPFVEAQAKMQRLLGDAYDAGAHRDQADTAWTAALMGWQRLATEYRSRRANRPAAEATVEVGRLLYALHRREQGLDQLEQALELDEDRAQSYVDVLALLVQHGEVEHALAVYRRAITRPDRVLPEYYKVYASLWIADLTRRGGKAPDATATAFLANLDRRHGDLRPTRDGLWYRKLARWAAGRASYADTVAAADTGGKRAEIFFYEAMRLLAEGKPSEAQDLWKRVVETHMFNFIEFEMASRYLRAGAPAQPRGDQPASTETI